jgi:hypothetical protein
VSLLPRSTQESGFQSKKKRKKQDQKVKKRSQKVKKPNTLSGCK